MRPIDLAERLKARFLGVVGVEALEFFGKEWQKCPVLAVEPRCWEGKNVYVVTVTLWGLLCNLEVREEEVLKWLDGPYGRALRCVDTSFLIY